MYDNLEKCWLTVYENKSHTEWFVTKISTFSYIVISKSHLEKYTGSDISEVEIFEKISSTQGRKVQFPMYFFRKKNSTVDH